MVSSITKFSVLPKYSRALSTSPRVFLLLLQANYSPCPSLFFLSIYHATNIAGVLLLDYQQVKFNQNFRSFAVQTVFQHHSQRVNKILNLFQKPQFDFAPICIIFLKTVLSNLHTKISRTLTKKETD